MIDPHLLTNGAVAQSLRASRSWCKATDVPDPLGRRDVLARPDLTAEALRRRVRGGWPFGMVRTFSYPKPSGSLREMTVLDPLADLVYRQSVLPLIGLIEQALPDSVLGTRSTTGDGSWATLPWRPALTTRREWLDEQRLAGWAAEGHFDVANHYPTVRTQTLALLLRSVGASEYCVARVVNVISMINSAISRSQGLPVGPDASAPLGTLALLPVDRLLSQSGIVNRRWMDDIDLFLDDPARFDDVVLEVKHQLGLGGQRLNSDKTRLDIPGGLDELASLGSGGSMLAGDPVDALWLAGVQQETSGVTFALGMLRHRRDPKGIEVLKSFPWMLERFPRQACSYLASVRSDVPDGLVESVVLEIHAPDLAGAQLHAIRLLQTDSIDVAVQLFDRGVQLLVGANVALASHYFAALRLFHRVPKKMRSRSLELSFEVADLNARRGLVAILDGKSRTRGEDSALRQLTLVAPDMKPTVAWLQAA